MTPEDVEKAYSFDQDVRDLIRFWVGQSIFRYYVMQRMGGEDEMIQETAVRMLEHRKTADKANCKWTTYVINNVKWTLWDHSRPLRIRYWNFSYERLSELREVPDDYHEKLARWADSVYRAVGEIRNQHAAEVFKLRHVDGRTLVDVGNELGITRERVRQLCDIAIFQLRQQSNFEELIPYDK